MGVRRPDWWGLFRRQVAPISLCKYQWDTVRTSFWFVPGVMVIGAIALSMILTSIDKATHNSVIHHGLLVTSPSDAKVILTTVAAATVAISGVVFSITVATLAIAAQQFGSRPLRSFMGNLTAQIAQGTFLATTLYCLLVLREVRDVDDSPYVPQISASVGVGLAILSLAFLVYFVHRIAVSIQAAKVVQAIGRDVDKSIDELFPENLGREPVDATCRELAEQIANLGDDFTVVPSSKEGYLEVINVEWLMWLLAEHDLVLQLAYRPGQFLIREQPVARIWPAAAVNERLVRELNACLVVGGRRTPRQDLECGIHEIAEVAVRALSPGINDPYTAVSCIERLGAALSRLALRTIPSPYRLDEKGRLRVVVPIPTFPEALAAGFRDIYEYGRNSFAVTVTMLEMLETLALVVRRRQDQAAILHEAGVIRKECEDALSAGFHDEVSEKYERVVRALRDKHLYMFPDPEQLCDLSDAVANYSASAMAVTRSAY